MMLLDIFDFFPLFGKSKREREQSWFLIVFMLIYQTIHYHVMSKCQCLRVQFVIIGTMETMS